MSDPTWAPQPSNVAAYVLHRTVPVVPVGESEPSGTFDDTTSPNSAEVAAIITDACRWVLAATGTVVSTPDFPGLLASTAAALRAAGWIELTYPRGTDDVNTATVLLAQADAARADAAAANAAATPGGPEGIPTVSFYATFPAPFIYGDLTL